MGRYDVTIDVGRLFENASLGTDEIEIDLIAMTNEAYCREAWFSHALGDYFAETGDPLRDGAAVWRASFSGTDASPRTLGADDNLWHQWHASGATHLVVIAEAPWLSERGDADDPRRLVLPLDRSRWLSDEIEVRLMRSGLVLTTRRLLPWPGQPQEKERWYAGK